MEERLAGMTAYWRATYTIWKPNAKPVSLLMEAKFVITNIMDSMSTILTFFESDAFEHRSLRNMIECKVQIL
jgi:uncharacterized membrane-anchored protein